MIPRIIVFDVFGTLLHFSRPSQNPYRMLLDAVAPLPERLPLLTRDVPIDVLAAELGIKDESTLDRIQRALAQDLAVVAPYADTAVTLSRLRRQGIRLAVCSNLAHAYGPIVKHWLPGLEAYLFSYEVGERKPEPTIFLAVCDALRCDPSEILFIGDKPKNDVEGPRAFGMQARLIRRDLGETLDEVVNAHTSMESGQFES